MRLRSVCASGPPRVIQSLLVFATFRNRSGLFCHRAAASCFGTSALPTGVVLLFLGSPPVRLAALRLWYSDRELPRGQGAISRFWQIHHNSAPAHWRVFVRHSAKKKKNEKIDTSDSESIRNRVLSLCGIVAKLRTFIWARVSVNVTKKKMKNKNSFHFIIFLSFMRFILFVFLSLLIFCQIRKYLKFSCNACSLKKSILVWKW